MDETNVQSQSPLIELSATAGLEIWREFYLFNCTKSAHMLPPLRILLTTACLLAALIMLVVISAPAWAFIPTGVLLLGIIMHRVYTYMFAPSVEYKKLGPLATTTYRYTFYPDHLDYTAQGTAERLSGTVDYTAFGVIYETGAGFYIYLTDGRAYLISKKQITDAQIIYLRGFFAGHFIKRFKCLCSENRTK